MSFINSLGVFIIFYFTYLITKKLAPALLTALIYAVSYEVIQYSSWLSNPALAIILVPLFYLGLYLWLKNMSVFGALLSGLGLGLSIQSNVSLGYHIVPLLILLSIMKKKISKTEIMSFLSTFILSILSMILVEFKFGFRGIAGLVYLFSGQDKIVAGTGFGDFIVIFFNQFGKVVSNNIFPLNTIIGGVMGLAALGYIFIDWYKNKRNVFSWQILLLSYLLSFLVASPFGGSGMPHITAGIAMGVIMLIGILIWNLVQMNKILLIVFVSIILGSNLMKVINTKEEGQTLFAIQPDLNLANEYRTLDDIYESSAGNKFSINTLTSPLYVNTLWSYLFNWYGNNKYGYIPEWRGRDQIGQLGNNLPSAEKGTDLHYFILEPKQGIPENWINNEIGFENSRSVLVSENKIGEITMQKRTIK